MKNISYEQYKKIFNSLIDYLDERHDAYEYIFKCINGREYGKRTELWERRKTLIRMPLIKEMWDSPRHYKDLIKLIILCHYRGEHISIDQTSSIYVSDDVISIFANRLINKVRNNYEKALVV